MNLDEITPVEVEPLVEEKPSEPITFTFSYPFGTIDPNFLNSIEGFLIHEISKPPLDRLLGSIIKSGSCYVGMNRGKICAEFLNHSQDSHLIMIDTDIAFQSNILEVFKEHIEENPEAHIIAGRVDIGNGLPVQYIFNDDHSRTHQVMPYSGLKEFDLIGTGIICISRHCIQTMLNHYKTIAKLFHHEIIGEELREMGDDFSFCLHAKECGFKLFGVWDIFGQHWKNQPIKSAYPSIQQLIVR